MPNDPIAQEPAQDFTNEPAEPIDTPPSVRAIPYDPRPVEDSARRTIAYILLTILGVMIAAAIELVVLWPDRIETVLKLYQLIFTPVVALVSAATGFYYATQSRRKGP